MATATATATSNDIVSKASKSQDSGLTLETEFGTTSIADSVVAKLAGQACREVDGVASMGKTFRRFLTRIRPGDESMTQGVNVEVGKIEAAIDIVIIVAYGYPIPTLAQEVRENVIARVEAGTGLIVKEVNIEVDDLQFEEEQPTSSRVQ